MFTVLFFVVASLCVNQALGDTTSGTFSALTYNVAGLPDILSSSDPSENTPQISRRLWAYDVIHVQEDFNYNDDLDEYDNHTYRTPTSGIAGIGSGLNTLSYFPYIDFTRITWDQCYIDDGDCLTPKGFTFMRVRVSDGMWVDMYNLHTDAGVEEGDLVARSEDIQQVTTYMAEWSVGMSVILMGDTNSRYTRDTDNVALFNLIDTQNMTDAWISIIRDGDYPEAGADALVCDFPFPNGTTQAEMVSCEVVDKIFTRPSSIIDLKAITYTNEDLYFLNGSGYPLSDHYPISAIMSWGLSSVWRMGDPYGGPHGNPYNDIPTVLGGEDIPSITNITLRGGNRLDAFAYTVAYSNGTVATISHGGTGGTPVSLTMGDGEYVLSMYLCIAKYEEHTRVFYALLTTNLNNTLTAGKTTDECETITTPTDVQAQDWGLVALWGRSGDEVDRVGPIWGAVY
ncbi:putative secreted protein [Fistulina hepatica ATCC 64428]|uniref:Putative secreted protein n=1 Tax=Fistulina hepatica ATCC 64428 TaxID=1128425 RepID=A0A0D7A854_9AGAR|nr:putative secreted protein [Fistulina hepatica ATCC 64428]